MSTFQIIWEELSKLRNLGCIIQRVSIGPEAFLDMNVRERASLESFMKCRFPWVISSNLRDQFVVRYTENQYVEETESGGFV